MLALVAVARKQLAARALEGPGALLDAQGTLEQASGNALFAGIEGPLRIRVNFLRPREVDAYDWDTLVAEADVLPTSVERSN